jgi:hypothetical protein
VAYANYVYLTRNYQNLCYEIIYVKYDYYIYPFLSGAFEHTEIPKVLCLCISSYQTKILSLNRGKTLKNLCAKRKVNVAKFGSKAGSAGHRARVPPDPIPNSEVKLRSVPSCIVVFGHENLGKLATLIILQF